MQLELSEAEARARSEFRAFVRAEVEPHAAAFDRDEALPRALLDRLATRGWLAGFLPLAVGGAGHDLATVGLLHEALGRACASTRSLLTVHGMVAYAIAHRGDEAQRARWLPALASGRAIGALALSEPDAGSDLGALATVAEPTDGGYRLRGAKRWISFGQIADVFLIFARAEHHLAAFLVEGTTAGLGRRPVRGLLGTRAAMLCDLQLDGCFVPHAHRVGADGLGLPPALTDALGFGRWSVAWGAVGLTRACLAASLQFTRARRSLGRPLVEQQLVQRMLSDMITGVRAARLLCRQASCHLQVGDPRALVDTLCAKYFATTLAARSAADAVQLHGAAGCTPDHAVERHFRDAKVLEIIEGSTELQQILIARHGAAEHLDEEEE